MDRVKFYVFIAGYWALVLAALGVIAGFAVSWVDSIPLFLGAAVLGALWFWGRGHA